MADGVADRRPHAARGTARGRILDAAVDLIRQQGLSATSVDDLCAAAGVTKGAFFHHFHTKEALAVAAAEHWSAVTATLFASAPYHEPNDPLDRLLAYIDFRTGLIAGEPWEFSCLVGTMVEEAFAPSSPIRAACASAIFGHTETLEADVAAAIDTPPASERCRSGRSRPSHPGGPAGRLRPGQGRRRSTPRHRIDRPPSQLRSPSLRDPESGVNVEAQVLLRHLNAQRNHVLGAVEGLSEEQLRRPVLPSGWSCLGMLKHLALADEHYWFRSIVGGEPLDFFPRGPNADWRVDPGESPDQIVELYRGEIERANAVIASTALDMAPRQRDPLW
jgi:AcrR family transcriptional regulator